MAREQEKYYSDLDLSLTVHPMTGDLIPKRNTEAVRRSIRHIFSLEAGDIPFQPDLHAGIKAMLFEPVDSTTAVNIEKRLEWLVKRMEPRAVFKKVQVIPSHDGTGYNISVWFSIKSIMVDDQYTFFIQRVR